MEVIKRSRRLLEGLAWLALAALFVTLRELAKLLKKLVGPV